MVNVVEGQAGVIAIDNATTCVITFLKIKVHICRSIHCSIIAHKQYFSQNSIHTITTALF